MFKKLAMAFLVSLPLFVGAAPKGSNNFTVKAEGMSCEACVSKVKENVAKVTKDVKGLVINVKVNECTVDYSKTGLTSEKEAELRTKVEKAITDAGFKVVKG